MKCERCGSTMVRELFFDTGSGDRFVGYHCIWCGEITDPGIEQNRAEWLMAHPPKRRVVHGSCS